MSNLITQQGFKYAFNPQACDTCQGKCCIGESGYIWVSDAEIRNIAEFLNISTDEFVQKYLILAHNRYSLKEYKISNNNYACIFFDKNQSKCSIYPVRPKQCRTFPFWDYFKNNISEVMDECPGIVLL
ncbi:MAG: YkgJ family cysteine cluster protein [Epsilonproteobacteria bacterium]|nr:YkgJ family cysteine cluster protein [Campylobacterota bacterium]